MPSKLWFLRCLTIACGLASSAAAQVWEVDNQLLMRDPPGANQFFGWAVAVGDVDADGFDDVVVAAPATAGGFGKVILYLGAADRSLISTSHRIFDGYYESRYGEDVALGDFDGDGDLEIAIGAPLFDLPFNGSVRVDAGVVQIVTLTSAGHTTRALTQEPTPLTSPETGDQFGYRVEVGNFDGDAYDDLAIGVPFEDNGTAIDAGFVHVFYGSASGLAGSQTFISGTGGLLGPVGAEAAGDWFGFALAAADFDDDGYDDLAVGAPRRDVMGKSDAGQVHVLYGTASGLTAAGNQLFGKFSFLLVPDDVELFGYALAAAPFNESRSTCSSVFVPCYADLAIGVPGEKIAGKLDVGKVMVLPGELNGVTAAGAVVLSQEVVGPSAPDFFDSFGFALAAGHFDRNRRAFASLVVGAPFDTPEGLVHLVFGSSNGPNGGAPDQTLWQQPGFAAYPPPPVSEHDGWGTAMAIGDLDGDGWGDLVIGIPEKEVNGLASAGVVQILYGGLFADGFESGGTGNWSAMTN